MKTPKILVVACLLTPMSTAWSAPAARGSAQRGAFHPVAARIAQLSAPELARGLVTPVQFLKTLIPSQVVGGAAAPATAEAAKTALEALEQGAVQSAQASRSGASAQEGQVAGQVTFDAADARVAELNAAVVETLQPFNNALTKASLVFNRLETNDKRATHADGTLFFEKQGSHGKATLSVDKLAYSYPEKSGAVPVTKGKVGLAFPLLNLWSQEEINTFGPSADKLIATFLADQAKKYQDAVTLEARITKKKFDANGNLTALGLMLGAKFDLSKLPEGVDQKDVDLLEGKIAANITLNGIKLAFKAVSNPQSSSFKNEQFGLKEAIDQLLARDPEAMEEIFKLAQQLDAFSRYLTTKGGNILGMLLG